MNCIRSLVPFGAKRRAQRDSKAAAAAAAAAAEAAAAAASPPPPILRVPNEILLDIMDHLELHDEFILSHTCRAFRTLTQRDWKLELEVFDMEQKVDFWSGLGAILPNYWICTMCWRLHPIDLWDRPNTYGVIPTCQHWMWDRLHYSEIYHLRHAHVQLAVKLTQRGGSAQHLKYLRKLLSPFTTKLTMFGLRLQYCASPKVVNGRFLLQVKHEFRNRAANQVSPTALQHHKVCPHVCQPIHLSHNLERAFANFGVEVSGHCQRCPTDYTLLANPGTLTILSWHDMGPGDNRRDGQWTAHLHSPLNTVSIGPRVLHRPGTVRDRYLFDGSVDGRAMQVRVKVTYPNPDIPMYSPKKGVPSARLRSNQFHNAMNMSTTLEDV